MRTIKIFLLLALLFLSIPLTVNAQPDSQPPAQAGSASKNPELEGYLLQLQSLISQKNYEGVITLIDTKPELAKQTFNMMVKIYPQMSEGSKKAAVLLSNAIARTLELRHNDPSFTKFLAEKGALVPEDTWKTTSLAKKNGG